MMGSKQVAQGSLFYRFSVEDHVPKDHSLRRIDLGRPLRHPAAAGAVLQLDRPAVDRSGGDHPDADRRLLLRYPLGAPALRRGPSEPGLPLVLPARSDGPRAGPFGLLQEPPWALPRLRPVPSPLRAGPDALPAGRRSSWRPARNAWRVTRRGAAGDERRGQGPAGRGGRAQGGRGGPHPREPAAQKSMVGAGEERA
jgi:hypothetical protein